MPELISVSDFLKEAWDDVKSPTTSNFIDRITICRQTVNSLEEGTDTDRSGLNRLKKSVKALYSTGTAHAENEVYLFEQLEKLGSDAKNREQQPEIGEALLKFSVVIKQLSILMKQLLKSLHNTMVFPLDSFLKNDLRGVKGDLKKPFEKSWKDYEAKFQQLEKDIKKNARDLGFTKKEVTGPEVAEDTEKERRMMQLQMCEYLLKMNDIRTKKGVDLLQHMVEYYHAQKNYFDEGLKTLDFYRVHVDDLAAQLVKLRQTQDAERRELVELRDALKKGMASYNRESTTSTPIAANTAAYSLHQLKGDKAHGNERTGYLQKKSEGKMRRVWQKRKCVIKDGFLSISHSDPNKPPVKLNLLTCQVKLVYEDPGKKCFDLVSSSNNRTYHFQADDTKDMEHWISVLNNAKQAVLMKAFGQSDDEESNSANQSVRELTASIIQEVQKLPGNKKCCDCNAPDPEWVSVNLGVLICLECCGVHRDMGVHISRTQSIVIDDLGTSQLLLARAVGNQIFNDVMEATLVTELKPTPASDMEERKNFIRAKYERKKYIIVTNTIMDDRKADLKQAILSKDLQGLIQVYAEGIDFLEPLDANDSRTALHLAIENEDGRSLFIVDFIAQNSSTTALCKKNNDGNTAVHLCALLDRPEALKILLRLQPELVHVTNKAGRLPLDLAQNQGHTMCAELIQHAMQGKSEMFQNINIDWCLTTADDHWDDDVDYSDDELDRCVTPDRGRNRSRPGSLILNADVALAVQDKTEPRSACLPGQSSTFTSEGLNGDEGYSSALPSMEKKPRGTATMVLPGGLSSSMHSINNNNSGRTGRKQPAPAPPPISYRRMDVQVHSRKHSDPGFSFFRSMESIPTDHKGLLPPPKEFQSRILEGSTQPQSHVSSQQPEAPPPPLPNKTKRPVTTQIGPTATDKSHLKPPMAAKPGQAGKPPPVPPKQRPETMMESVSGSSSISPRLDVNEPPPPLPPKQVLSPVTELQNLPTLRSGLRVKALFNCEADNDDELSFKEGEMIVLVKQEEEEWWEGHILANPSRKGLFPISFVTIDETCFAHL